MTQANKPTTLYHVTTVNGLDEITPMIDQYYGDESAAVEAFVERWEKLGGCVDVSIAMYHVMMVHMCENPGEYTENGKHVYKIDVEKLEDEAGQGIEWDMIEDGDHHWVLNQTSIPSSCFKQIA